MTMPGCGYVLEARVGKQTAFIPADYLAQIKQIVEAQDLYDAGFGATGAKSLILGFCVRSAVTGTFPVSLQNPNTSRSWVTSYTVSVANTTQCYSYTVPGDPSGAMSSTPTNPGLQLAFDWGSGSTYQTSIKAAWVSGNYYGLTGLKPFVANAPNTIINISSVRMYPGGVDMPWVPRTYAEELRRAQRYYQKTFAEGTKPTQAAGMTGAWSVTALYPRTTAASIGVAYRFTVPMRIAPNMTGYSTGAGSANCFNTTRAVDAGALSAAGTSSHGGTLKCALTESTGIGDLLAAHIVFDSRF